MSHPTDYSAVRRKLLTGIASLAVFSIGVASPMYASGRYQAAPDAGLVVFGACMMGVLASLAYLFRAVRCPRCGYRLFANAFLRQPAGSVVSSIASGCPSCGLRWRVPS